MNQFLLFYTGGSGRVKGKLEAGVAAGIKGESPNKFFHDQFDGNILHKLVLARKFQVVIHLKSQASSSYTEMYM